jgi:hypothetical protein
MTNQYDWGNESENPFGEFLELNPAAAYHSYSSEWGSPMGQRHYQNQFQDVYNQYLGSLGGLLRQGVMPSGSENTFANYLGDYDWSERYTSLPPQMRGEFSAQFNPRTRQIYF